MTRATTHDSTATTPAISIVIAVALLLVQTIGARPKPLSQSLIFEPQVVKSSSSSWVPGNGNCAGRTVNACGTPIIKRGRGGSVSYLTS